MTIYIMPTSPRPKSVTFSLRSNTLSHHSPLDGTTQTQTRQGDRWRADFVLPPMNYLTSGDWVAWLAKLRGMSGRFYGYDPAHHAKGARGSVDGIASVSGSADPIFPSTGLYPSTTTYPTADSFAAWVPSPTITVSSAAAKGATSVDLTGLPQWDYSTYGVNPAVEASNILNAGDYIEINGEMKMLTVSIPFTNDITATAEFTPPMRAALSGGESVDCATPQCQMMLIDDSQATWDINEAIHFGIQFSAVEVFP
jgi:hypothetical protein